MDKRTILIISIVVLIVGCCLCLAGGLAFGSMIDLATFTPAVGKTPAAVGKTPAAVGKTPAAVGKTPAAVGKTPAAVGKTPAAQATPKSPYLENVTVARGMDENYRPVNPVDGHGKFSRNEPVYILCDLRNAQPGTRVIARFKLGTEEVSSTALTAKDQGDARVWLKLFPDGGWPSGTYQAALFVDDKLFTNVFWTVK